MKKWVIALILFVLHAIIIAIGTPYPSIFLLFALFISSIVFCIYSLVQKEEKKVSITLLSIMLLELIILAIPKQMY